MRERERERDLSISCTPCEKTFTSRDNFNEHNKIHHDETSFKCNICWCPLPLRVTLEEHIANKHSDQYNTSNQTPKGNQRPMQRLCLSCNVYFQTEDKLTKHVDDNHVTDVRKFCPRCSNRPNNNRDLKKHLADVHNEGWRFQRKTNFRNFNHHRAYNNSHHSQRRYDPRQWEPDFYAPTTSNRFAALNNQGNGYRG